MGKDSISELVLPKTAGNRLFHTSPFSSHAGMSIIELLVTAGASMILVLALGALFSDVIRSRKSAEQASEYIQFVNIVQRELMQATSCNVLGGEFNYDPSSDTTLPGVTAFKRDGTAIQSYLAGQMLPGSRTMLVSVVAKAQPDASAISPVTLTVDNLAQPFDKIFTYIEITASRDTGSGRAAMGGNALRPVLIPIMLYRQRENNPGRVRYCGSNSVGSGLCSQMGGAPVMVDTADGPQQRCDILPAYGGCARGGRYTMVNGQCSTTNPYTQDCTCPSGLNIENQTIEFAARKIADYRPSKGTRMEQYECLRCTENVVPPPEWALPVPYDEDRLEMDIACGYSDIATYPDGSPERSAYLSMCPCAPPNETSTVCQCYTDPTITGCDNVCNYDPGSCECLEQQYLAETPGTPAYDSALNAYNQQCNVYESPYGF